MRTDIHRQTIKYTHTLITDLRTSHPRRGRVTVTTTQPDISLQHLRACVYTCSSATGSHRPAPAQTRPVHLPVRLTDKKAEETRGAAGGGSERRRPRDVSWIHQ